uniref:Uncharacterized protein n=1 Tax=Sarcoptes scabiei TaxID=52283 RepID=A0A834R6I6_SARSC
MIYLEKIIQIRKLFTIFSLMIVMILSLISFSQQSIGYFENYGWPSYGIVKPFWMTPFSSYPTKPISGYSRSAKILSAGVVRSAPGTGRNNMFRYR